MPSISQNDDQQRQKLLKTMINKAISRRKEDNIISNTMATCNDSNEKSQSRSASRDFGKSV